MDTHLEVPQTSESPRNKRIAELANKITETYKDFLRVEVLTAMTIKIAICWDGTMCSLVDILPTFRRYLLPPSSEHSSNLKMGVGGSSEMLINIYQTTRRPIPTCCNVTNV
jgi:hypothetical protein